MNDIVQAVFIEHPFWWGFVLIVIVGSIIEGIVRLVRAIKGLNDVTQ